MAVNNKISCPLCPKELNVGGIKAHWEERHGISVSDFNKVISDRLSSKNETDLKSLASGTPYTEGKELNVSDREFVSEGEAEQTAPKYGEAVEMPLDSYGDSLTFPDKQDVASQIRFRFDDKEADLQYMEIYNNQAITQYKSEEEEGTLGLVTIAVVAIIVAAAIIAVLLTIDHVAKNLYELAVKGGPAGVASVGLIIGVLAIGGYTLYNTIK